MMTKGKKAIIPPAPPTWAIKDKFSGNKNDDITVTPISRYCQSFSTLHWKLNVAAIQYRLKKRAGHDIQNAIVAGSKL
jgi:hypothetical protein